MLTFLREKARYIGIVIIAFFVLTMSAGAFYFKDLFKQSRGKKMSQTVLGTVGNLPIDSAKYTDLISQTMAQFQQQHIQHIDPEMAEMVAYSCLTQAAQYTILKESAKTSKIKVSSDEVDQSLESVYREYDLKDKKQLKALLKKNNYPYDQFIDNVKQDILVQKFSESLKSQVTVTEQDIKNKYTQVLVQHILLLTNTDTSGTDEQVLKKIQEIETQIHKGLSFSEAAVRYSQDSKSKDKKGELGWISYGKTLKEFEDVAFSLDKEELSKPVKTAMGYHLIKVIDRKTAFPASLDLKKEKDVVLQEKQNRAVQNYIQSVFIKSPLQVTDPGLKAYHAKISGDVQGAINAYQGQISVNPANPVPHYLLGKLYLLTGDKEKAQQDLEKGSLKAEMNPQSDFPGLHVALGRLYKEQHKEKEKEAQFTKAIALAAQDQVMLKQLATFFKSIQEPSAQAQIEKALKQSAELPVALPHAK